MRQVDYTDARGRWYRVELPDNIPDDQAALGVPIGPPDVADYMELPEPYATRLHNQLFMRHLFTAKDIRSNPSGLQGAILSAFSVDAATIHEAYVRLESDTESV